jgi:hypothetical protein
MVPGVTRVAVLHEQNFAPGEATGAMNHYSDLVTVAMVPDQTCHRPATPVPPPGRHSS